MHNTNNNDNKRLPRHPPPAARPARPAAPRHRWVRRVLMVFGGLTMLVLGWVLGSTGVALWTIHQNLQAMALPTVPAGSGVPTVTPGGDPLVGNAPLADGTPAPAGTPTPTYQPEIVPDNDALGDGSTSQPTPDAAQRRNTPTPDATVRAALLRSATPAPPPTIPPMPTLAPLVGNTDPPPARDEPVHVLVLGIDQRPGETEPARTDAMSLIRIDPRTNRVAMLSLPRDLIVDVPGYGSDRINEAHVIGENIAPGAGPQLARRTVSDLLDIPVHYVVRLNFQGFVRAIDAIGGVEIYVEQELYDPLYPTMDYGYISVYFPVGLQTMDGKTALVYSRVRHADSDFARMQRQHTVMLAAFQRVRDAQALNQLQTIADLTTALREYVQTDMPIETMLDLAWNLRGLSPDDVERYTLDETMVTSGWRRNDPYALAALPGTLDAITADFVGPEPTPTANATTTADARRSITPSATDGPTPTRTPAIIPDVPVLSPTAAVATATPTQVTLPATSTPLPAPTLPPPPPPPVVESTPTAYPTAPAPALPPTVLPSPTVAVPAPTAPALPADPVVPTVPPPDGESAPPTTAPATD